MSDTEGQGGGTENEGADPSQPVESQQQADQQVEKAVASTQFTGNQAGEAQADADKGVEAAVGATQFTGNQAGEAQADADKGVEAAVGATQFTGNQQGESMEAAHAQVEQAVAATTFTGNQQGESMEQAHQQVTRAVDETDWSNVGTQKRTWASVSMPAAPISPGLQLDLSPALSVFFSVSLDVIDLGMWSKMSGLGLQIESKSRPDSAMSFLEHHLPGHITYNHITLERPLSTDSQLILEWISTYHMLPIPTAGQIICLDQTGTPIIMWEMIGVSPVSWKGPTLDAHGLSVVTEQLTLAHMGFL
jgi:phage tail-like protein